jgi:hypothetical protein
VEGSGMTTAGTDIYYQRKCILVAIVVH